MTKNNLKKFISIIQKGQKALSGLSDSKRKELEKAWDIEHAYYSSALEGSKIDRKQFEKLAEKLS